LNFRRCLVSLAAGAAVLLVLPGAVSAAYASGPPCNGCVGLAAGKNQLPQSLGDQKNNGYECDSQTGVGDGNPAHPGCTPLSGTTTGGATTGGTTTGGTTGGTPTNVVTAASPTPPAPAALAAPTLVLGEQVVAPAPAAAPAPVAPAPAVRPAKLAFTGSSDELPIALLGLGLVLAGFAMRRSTRVSATT